ncbi:MAG TPA: PEP-utilizing enzyme [Dehalococcoidia bacterium]|nr:PEP-utilizing enzyme [Dehalococcoidia bacterium]
MLIRATDDFRFEWPDPADANLVWLWDQMHIPRPLPPLAAELTAQMMARVMGGRSLIVNGYPYRSFGPPAPAASPGPAGPPLLISVDPMKIWEEEQLPRLKEIIARIRHRDYGSMSAARLAGSLDELSAEAAEAMSLTFGRAMVFSVASNALLDFCEAELGAGAAVKATAMLQGFENESSASGAGLSRLAEMASGVPGLPEALASGSRERVAAVRGSEAFLRQFEAYLDAYGLRAPSWGQMHLPTWSEDPSVPMKLIARYASDPQRGPAAALRRAAQQREEVVREVEARLPPDKLPRFRELLAAAQRSVPVSEGRALWQLIVSGVMRIPLLALGRRLVEESGLASPEDVFFFDVSELQDLAAGHGVPAPRELAAQRRADLARWEKLIPPRFLGAQPPAGMTGMTGMMYRFFGLGVEQSGDARIVNGIAASKGVVRARARLILDLGESDRLGAGEVLVCSSTAPPWTPLFAIASAVVSDTGGVLSHTAIAAREYAIPAVVGTGVATRRIPDGATVTVDGGQGIVRIED